MRRLIVTLSAAGAGLLATPALAADQPAPAAPAVASTRLSSPRYAHWFGALSLGRGVRFNNPYRLNRQLGESGESLSLAATYLDLALGVTSVGRGKLEHGAVAHLSVALQGIPQEVLSLSYLAQWRLLPQLLLYGRGGVPIVLEPDLNAGLELGAGATWLLRSGLGLNAELIGSLFYGAATLERSVSTIPMLSLQIGLAIDYEVLP